MLKKGGIVPPTDDPDEGHEHQENLSPHASEVKKHVVFTQPIREGQSNILRVQCGLQGSSLWMRE